MMDMLRRNHIFTGDVFGSAEDNQRLNDLLQPDGMSVLVGITTAVIVGIWEFCSFFPAELVLWRRIIRRIRPGSRWGWLAKGGFAPWTTLALRYMMLCYAVSKAFVIWSTTMTSIAACQAASGFNIASGIMLNAIVAFAIAWRAQAVAQGVIQTQNLIRLMQLIVALLVVAEIFIGIFCIVYPTVLDVFWKPILVQGSCVSRLALHPPSEAFPQGKYALDPLLWFYVVTIIFNLALLTIVLLALHSLACRSRGFSKLITGMRNHSLFLFFIILILSLVAIIWRAFRGVTWIYEPVTVIEAAVTIRILLAEQDAARRPMDTTFIDNGNGARCPSTRRTVTRGDGVISNQMPGLREYHLHQQELIHQYQQQQMQQNNQQGHHSAPLRTFHQPFSVMDNLGQAFSQIDSRNSRDIEDQSVHSVCIARGAYPGVMTDEKQGGRIATEEDVKEVMKSSPVKNARQRLHRSQSVQSIRQLAMVDYDSDEEEIGTQTVNF